MKGEFRVSGTADAAEMPYPCAAHHGRWRLARLLVPVLLGLLAVVASLPIVADGSRASAAGPMFASAPAPYAWPVKPFRSIHPVRGYFGDPRTRFVGPPTRPTLYHGAGSFSFHVGVDIVVPDGTPVYPVRSGVVTRSGMTKVFVDSGTVSHQYWHIHPEVAVGARVVAYETVLGRVRRNYGHVHFVELRGGHPVNPLAAGHLSPYVDRTTPHIGPITLRRPKTYEELLPELVRGRVEVVVDAYDRPSPAASGQWAIMPTAPALLTWRVERARDRAIVTPDRVAFDVRLRAPPLDDFWRFYARGTRQNMATFNEHRYWRQPGRFVFRLGLLDTRRLVDGIYAVVATARDVRGNAATTRTILLVYNRPTWPPRTPQT